MTTTRITLDKAGQYLGQLNKEMVKASIRGLLKAGQRTKTAIILLIIPARVPKPVDRGVYRAGWKVEPLVNGCLVLNNEPHAAFIEHGVRAENVKVGRAMIDALTEWVERHGLVDPDEDVTARSIAWAIAMSMKRRGIFNHYAGKNGLFILGEAVRDYVPRYISEEVSRELGKL